METLLDQEMKCDHGGCSASYIPKDRFAPFSTQTLYAFKCSISSIGINALNSKGEIFGLPNCKVSDLNCFDNGHTIVWNQSVIHKCPLEKLSVSGRFKYSKVIDSTPVLINSEQRIALKLKSIQQEDIDNLAGCNVFESGINVFRFFM